MTVLQTSGRNPEELLHPDDAVWLQDVLDLIPKSVYGEDRTHARLNGNSEKESQKNVKKNSPNKKRLGNKGQTRESSDARESRQASLKKKLHEKLLAKREARKADDESYIAARAAKKRKRDEKSASASREGKKLRMDKEHVKQNRRVAAQKDSEDVAQSESRKRRLDSKEENAQSVSLETTRVSGFGADKPARKVKRRKLRGGKLLELQKKLEEVNRQNELDQRETMTSGAAENLREGKGKSEDEATGNESQKREMEKAMQRAQGIDVKDDAKKLKKSIRKEKRKSEKSKEEWAKRKKTQEMEQSAKQEKKSRNLAERKAKKGSTSKSRAGLGKNR